MSVHQESTDVVVIGGGLLGCVLAWMLARSGCDVILLERDQLNAHASGQNAGSLHFQLEYRMVEHGQEQANIAAEAMPLHLRAAALWRELGNSIGDSLGVACHGGLMLAETPDQVKILQNKAELERSWDLSVDVIDGEELHNKAPYLSRSVLAAAYCPLEGKADTRTAGPAFARAAATLGAQIRTGAEVFALERQAGSWQIRAGTRQDGGHMGAATAAPQRVTHISADAVVLAAGIWTTQLGALADVLLPTIPLALTMTATAKQPPLIPHLIQHVGKRLSLKQATDGNFLIGGGWPARLLPTAADQQGIDSKPQLVRHSVAGNARAAMEVAPALSTVPVVRTWVGTTTITSDQLPLMGPVPGRQGLFVATGGSAFTLGPAFAEVLTDLILGKTSEFDIAPYHPGRFGG